MLLQQDIMPICIRTWTDKTPRWYACEPTLWQDSVPICLRNRPCAGTVLPHTIDKLIAPLRLLLRYGSRQYAYDLPTKWSCLYAYDLRTRQPSHWYACDPNRQDTVLIRLRNKPNNNYAVTPTAWANNCAYMPTINQPTNRQTLYLTTITTATGTILPPK